MFDIRSFSLGDIYRCSADLRSIGETSHHADEAARRTVSFLFDELRFPETGAAECPLVRLFRTARCASGDVNGPADGPLCLSLWATRGVEPDWNEPARSKRHRMIPLGPAGLVPSAPMISELLSQLRIPTAILSGSTHDASDTSRRLLDVFHVEDAHGSPFIPDQAEFVERYGVESVLGFGGILPSCEAFVVLLFSQVRITKAAAELFRTLAPSIGLALVTPERDRGSLEARVRAYEVMVRHHEKIALDQQQELERTAQEREILLADAQRARADAQAATCAKDDFLARLGHELRNPLAPILTAVELMRLRGARSREQDIIERQALHLARLVDDLLDVARISRGKVDVHKMPVELAEVVRRAVEIASPALDRRAQVLFVSVPAEGLLVNADAGRLAQVVSNVLDNASKYSEPETSVWLSGERVGDRVILRVRDEGVGIAPEMLEAVFESFVQERERDAARPGLGLGLAIARSLVSMHDGVIYARSDGPGKGSEIVIELPALTQALAPPEHRDGEEVPCRGRSKRVLLVDDNADTCTVLGEALGELGLDVRVAADGPTALALAESFHPEVALVDLGLPRMDGYELATRLRSLPGASDHLRLVAVSGHAHEHDRGRSREVGFTEHLVKPVRLDALMRAVA